METYQVFFKYKNGEFWQEGKAYVSATSFGKNSHEQACRLFVKQNKEKYDNLNVWKVVYV